MIFLRGFASFPSLMARSVSSPGPVGRTLMTIHYSKLKPMSPPTNDPMLPVILSKLTAIERSIDKLATHVGVQNGRIKKLEEAEAQERAVTEHIDREIQAHNAEANRRSHLMTGGMSACAAILGGVIAVIVERLV